MLDSAGRALRKELSSHFRRPPTVPLTDTEFDGLARRIFAYQLERNPPYAAYCRSRARTPETIASWRDIPAVPTAAFKEVDLVAGDPALADAVFRTSGTTEGRRGTHYLPDLATYHGALMPNFRAHVVPDIDDILMLALVPPPAQQQDSSLAHMVGVVIDRAGAPDSEWFVSVTDGLAEARLEETLTACARAERPVLLLGTSFAFVHWTDSLRARGHGFQLPQGSRLMDTGGYKGRSREVSADALRATYRALLGIPDALCVNEYGMTEMCSQFYDATLRERLADGGSGERRKVPPAWVRTVVVDADTLEPVENGRAGLLRHYDLANIGSVLAVQTEDVGVAVGDGFRVDGRSADAQPRGCSIATDELLRAARAPV